MNDSPSAKKPGQPSVELRSDVTPPNVPQPIARLGNGSPFSGGGKKTIGIIVGLLLLFIIVGLGAWAALRTGDGNDGDDDGTFFEELPFVDSVLPVTTSGLSGRECEDPDRRPIAAMLAGDPINRPMSGFSQADMVWELPVLVSNVTRLMAVYQCGHPTDIGSVRSARHDYLFLAAGIDAILSHWGGSYHALNRVTAGEFQTLNALVNPSGAFFRKNHLPAPYNGFTTYENLWTALQEAGYRTETEFKGYDFKDDAPVDERPAGGTLSVGWPGSFRVHYEYDPETNRYVRYWAGTRQVDAENDEVVAPSAVVVIRATNEFADGPGGYNDVGIQGTGTGTLFQDGGSTNITWSKSAVKFEDPMRFKDAETGREVTFTRGQVWIMTPSEDIPVTWEVEEAEGTAATAPDTTTAPPPAGAVTY